MDKLFNKNNIIITAILLIIAVVSLFVIAPVASSVETHKSSIEKLDTKKIQVLGVVASTAGASALVACIPGDATTPVANQIASLTSYLMLVVGVIFLEKILLTTTGIISFKFIIPIACLIGIVYVFSKKEMLKNLAIKLGIFALVIVTVIPLSVQITNAIEKNYQEDINKAVVLAETQEKEMEKNKNIIAKFKDKVMGLGDKAKEMLSSFIDAVAILVITTCVIPIAVLFVFIWIVKIIFGIDIPVQKIIKTKEKNEKSQIEE